jgi:hypothetical protein
MELIADPVALRKRPDLIAARASVATILREWPDDAWDPADDLDIMQIRGAHASHVRLLLQNSGLSERGEREGILNIALRTPISYDTGAVLTPRDMRRDATAKSDTLRKELGMSWSGEVIDLLSTIEKIAAIRYAYSCRHRRLYDMIARGDSDVLALQERFMALEDRCHEAIRRATGAR